MNAVSWVHQERAHLRDAAGRLAAAALLGVLPLISVVIVLSTATASDRWRLAYDFHHELYPQAELVARGANPYPRSDADLSGGTNNVWPTIAVVPIIPLTAFRAHVADWIATALALASLAGALWLLAIRDWRVYGVVLLWPPVISAYQTANLTLPLCLLTAIAYRYRRASLVPGLAVGAAIAAKFFLWPLAVWLASRRRYAEALLAVVFATASLLLLLPFTSILDYARLVRNLSDTFDGLSYTIYALAVDAGAPSGLARAATLIVGLAVVVLAWHRRSLPLAIGGALILSPIVWLHFFALLVVALAVAHPRFDLAWLVPLPLWLVAGTSNGAPWQTALALMVFAGVLVASELPRRGPDHSRLEGITTPPEARAPTRA